MENKKKTKKKNINYITDEDLQSYKFGSENQSPNIKALPVKKKIDPKKELREIPIDFEKASKQTKLEILGIEVYFPYEPYPNQKTYMEKVIEACKNKTIAGLESPTGTGKTLCLLCASLAYLKYERERIIKERQNNFDVIDNNEKIRQPVIFYTSRTHAQLSNVIQELQKTCYRPRNAIISSRDQMCVNELIKGFHGHTLNMKCQFAQKKNQCRYFKGKNNLNMTWAAYDGKTVEELKEIAKKAKFCPFFFERDKSIHSDMIFLPYNYVFDPSIKKRMKIQMNNAILIVDEAHNIQEVCNDAVSKDFDSNMIDEVLNDLKSLKIFMEENQITGTYMDGAFNEKSSKNVGAEPINLEQLKNEINILNNIKNTLMGYQIKSGDKWPNFGLKLDSKGLFDLFYLGSKGNNQKQTTIQFNNNTNNKRSSSNNKFKLNNNKNNPPISNNKKNERKNENPNSEKTHKSEISNEDDEEPLDSEDEFNLEGDKLEAELTPNNISTHINHLSNYEFFIHNDRGKRTLLGLYIEVLELIKLLTDNYIQVETSDDTNPLHNYTNNFRFFIEDVVENQNKNLNLKKKNITNFIKKKNRILHIYCFNPGFGFKKVIDEKLHSTIITSGTLSPIDGMESELKCSFQVKLEGTHVIDKKQVHFGILTSSIFNNKEEFVFNATNRNNNQMVNNLGKTIIELCKITPGGILVFFSSYGVMEDFIKKWEKAKIISEISKYKEFCQDKHDQKLNKAVLDIYQKSNSSRDMKGGILFSVCRGSCSEGMNFKNDYARLVIVVGIPYAYLGDPKTQLRKEYQDEFNKYYYSFIKDKNIKKLSGSEWYNQNAIKCVNQALGRVIRHSNDYGCMLLIDSRYQQNNNKYLISKWIRDLNIIYNNRNNDNLISNIEKFFIEADIFVNNKIKEKKKMDELNENNRKKESISKKNKIKNKKDNLNQTKNIINRIENNEFINEEEELDEEEINYTKNILKSSNKRKKKNLPQINDNKHFNIINDIKIDGIGSNNNNNKKDIYKMKKMKKNKELKTDSNMDTNSTITQTNSTVPFLENNLDLAAIFGDDIQTIDPIEEFENENKTNNENIDENILNNINSLENNNMDNDKKEEENNLFSGLMDEFKEVGASFFDSLKEEESNKKSPHKKNINTKKIKDLTIAELAEEIKRKKDNPDFREELKKNGLNFTLVDKNDSNDSSDSFTNILRCPICFNTTNDPNVKMEVCGCGHSFCHNCLDKIENNNLKSKCPVCKRKIKINERRKIYV